MDLAIEFGKELEKLFEDLLREIDDDDNKKKKKSKKKQVASGKRLYSIMDSITKYANTLSSKIHHAQKNYDSGSSYGEASSPESPSGYSGGLEDSEYSNESSDTNGYKSNMAYASTKIKQAKGGNRGYAKFMKTQRTLGFR